MGHGLTYYDRQNFLIIMKKYWAEARMPYAAWISSFKFYSSLIFRSLTLIIERM